MKIKQRIKTKYDSLHLHIKIGIILTFVILLISGASIISSMIITRSSNQLLYQALAGSLNYSAEDISSKLSNIESMTNSIISNQSIRKSLIGLVYDKKSAVTIKNVKNSTTSSLIDYFQTYKGNNINYITLHSPDFTASNYDIRSSATPAEIHNEVLNAAADNSGYACWVTDYCNDYGLFLGRDSRRVLDLKFETLGTVIVNVDMDKLINSSTKSILYDGNVQYVLYENGQEIYHSETLDPDDITYLNSHMNSSYSIVTLDKQKYFCTSGKIENNNWDYICLVPYAYVENSLKFTHIFSCIILVIAITIAILLARLLIRSITNDFSKLIRKMKKFGQDESAPIENDYDYSKRSDEIALLHLQFDEMANEIQNLIQQNYIHEILSKDAKLKALESQINPHFLYNALESVNWRAKAIGATDISMMVQSLGDLLRATLSNQGSSFTIREELRIVRDYITIQQIRFDEERLLYEEVIEEC